jgi:hypothetical protein
MGQNLATGLVLQMQVDKQEADRYKLSLEEVMAKMRQEMRLNTDLYAVTTTKTAWFFELKPEIVTAQLQPFLKDFYAAFYKNGHSETAEVLESLVNLNPQDLEAFLEEESWDCFQGDEYAEGLSLHFEDKDFRPRLRLSRNFCVILALEGKIGMECYGEQFAFWAECMALRFAQHLIAGALDVYITG